MAEQGKRKRGRPKGSRNKRTTEVLERAEKNGQLPGEWLLNIMRGQPLIIDGEERIPTFAERMEAAKAAAPYYQPKLASVEQKIEAVIDKLDKDVDSPPKETRAEWEARIQEELSLNGEGSMETTAGTTS